MDARELLEFLEGFEQGEVWQSLKAVRAKRAQQHKDMLGMELKDVETLSLHVRWGGVVEGLEFDELTELKETLKEKVVKQNDT